MLLDDRDERPGAKFKDADLLGIPYRITVGKKYLQDGIVELRERKGGEVEELSPGQLLMVLPPRIIEAINR